MFNVQGNFLRSFLPCLYALLDTEDLLLSYQLHAFYAFRLQYSFLILNFFSHCLSTVVSRLRLYLTSHGQCSGLWSLVT